MCIACLTLVLHVLAVAPLQASPAAVPPAPPPQLQRALQAMLSDPGLRRAKVGLYVSRLRDGQTLFAHLPDHLLVPASNVKMITAAAALARLGPDYQFTTDVFGDLDARGQVRGDLTIKGYGDPYLVPERLYHLATRLKVRGVSHVEGDIVVDDSYFAGPRLAYGWEHDDSDAAYMAPAGALSVGFNALQVHVLPGAAVGMPARIVLDPASDYVTVAGSVRTVARGRSRIAVDLRPGPLGGDAAGDVVRVSGRMAAGSGGRAFWRRVNQPDLYFGATFKAALAQVGIGVAGKVRRQALPPDTQLPKLWSYQSPRLAELIGPLNKYSNNFIAAQIALALGAATYGAPGTWEKGKAAMAAFLQEELQLPPSAYVLGNASGLHEVNAFSPRQLVALIETMHQNARLWPEFVGSLAVAGGLGTLQDRMVDTGAAGLLRAKTGTLAGASALSGLVRNRGGDTLAFSFIVNGFRSLESVWRIQDHLGSTLAEAELEDGPAATRLLQDG